MPSVQTYQTVQDFYIAYYQRPGDPTGERFWADRLDVNPSLDPLLAAFGNSPESQALYGPINSTTIGDVIDKIYLGLFDRPPDAAGKQFYIDGFNAGTFTAASIAYNILVGAQNDDEVSVINKEQAANQFTETVDGRTYADPSFGQGTSFAATYAGPTDEVQGRAYLDSVTANPQTVPSESQTVEFIQTHIANPGDPILLVTPGLTFGLTPSVDIVTGTAGNDLVVGVFGSATAGENTYTTGDSINGGAGNDTLSLTAAGTLASPNAVTVKAVETVTIRDLVGSTLDSTLISDNPTISFTDTLAGKTSMVVGGSLGSLYGLAGAGNLTVDFSSTAGAADTAKVSVSGAGTSTTARSTIDVSDGGTIEAISLAASGTNFLTVNGGSAAKLTMTGAGTNNIAVGTMAAIATIDASATTGTNTFGVAGTLNTGDAIKGGTGADTLNAKFTGAVLANPTISGVETIGLEFDGAATLNLSKTTGATTVSMLGNDADATLSNADASLVNLKVLNLTTAGKDVTFSHATGVTAPLTMQIGGATGTSATNIDLDTVTLKGTSSLTINAVGTKDYTINALLLDHDQDSVTVSVGDGADLNITPLNAQGHDIDALTVTVGEGANFSGTVQMSGGDLGDVAFTVNKGGSGDLQISNSGAPGGNIGDISFTLTGNGAAGEMEVNASGGDVGDITMTVNGTNASGDFESGISGGSYGNITVSVTGTNAHGDMAVSANGHFDNGDDNGGGNIGDVKIDVQGTNAEFSGNFTASGGDIGDVSLSYDGVNVSGSVDFRASQLSGDVAGPPVIGDGNDYVRGGNIGDVTVDINGTGAEIGLHFTASGGDIGDVSYSLDGVGASGFLDLAASLTSQSGDAGGNIGSIDIVLGDNVIFSGLIVADVSTGGISVLAGDSTSGFLRFSGGEGNAQFGDMTMDLGENGAFFVEAQFISGNTGMITAGVGAFGDLDLQFGWVRGNVGAVTVTAAENTFVEVESIATLNTMDAVTLIGGAGGSGLVTLDDPVTLFGGVEASAWEGFLNVNLIGVTAGSVVTAGAGGSTITATGFADNIFGGAGVDTIIAGAGDDTVTGGGGNDKITGGTGADILQGDAGNDTFNVAAIADFASGEVVAGGAGTDVLAFAAAGAITYVGRTVTGLETLDLTPGAGNAVVVLQGTGLATVKDLGVVGATLTLNKDTTLFNLLPEATTGAVNVAGEWFYNGTGADDGVLTYFDQPSNAAVTVTLVGVETGALTGGVANAGGNLVFTQA